MLYLIPRPLHRVALRVAHVVRHHLRGVLKVQLRGVSVKVHDRDGAVLLVRHSYGPDNWSLPSGGCKRGEDPQDTAMRELQEEVGIVADQLELLETIEEVLSGAPHTAYVFRATCDGAVAPDRREIIEARFFAVDDLPPGLSALTRRRLGLD